MTGGHNLFTSEKVTRQTLTFLFEELDKQRVDLAGIILKPNMVLPGLSSPDQVNDEAIADATLLCLLDIVPATVPRNSFFIRRPNAGPGDVQVEYHA
jgi:fructose-bisphosphate aldolase class I